MKIPDLAPKRTRQSRRTPSMQHPAWFQLYNKPNEMLPHQIWVRRQILMPRSQGLEAEKEEIPDEVFEPLEMFVEAGDDVCAAEPLLRELEQGHEGLFGAVAQLLRRDVDVETSSPQHGVPRGQLGVSDRRRVELETQRLVAQMAVLQPRNLGRQVLTREVRGISM